MLLKAGADWTITDYRGRTPEQVIFDHDGDDMTVKEAFIKLRDEEDARRKAKEEEEKEGKKADGDAEPADKKEGESEGEVVVTSLFPNNDVRNHKFTEHLLIF